MKAAHSSPPDSNIKISVGRGILRKNNEYKYGGEKRSCFAKYGKDKPKKEIDITINKTNGLIVQRWFLYTFTCLWEFMALKEFWAAYRVTKFWLCQRQNRGC